MFWIDSEKGGNAFRELVNQGDLLSQENLPGISGFPNSVERNN
jgi:hypothetical protein